MKKPRPESEQIKKLIPVALNRFTFSRIGEYTTLGKTRYLCDCLICGGQWDATLTNLIKGRGCPHCAKEKLRLSRLISEESQLVKLSVVAANRFVFERLGEYVGSLTKYRCTCLIDGGEYTAPLADLLAGQGCPHCAKEARRLSRLTTPEQQIAKIYAASAGRYSFQIVGEHTTTRATKVSCVCATCCHKWPSTVASLISGSGCPLCATRESKEARTMTPQDLNDRLVGLCGGRIKFSALGPHLGTRSLISCACVKCEHKWESVAYNLFAGRGCPSCASHGYNHGKPGTLYALRSRCGSMVKIGISNKPEQRHKQLITATPFEWDWVDLVQLDNGATIARMEKELHQKMERIQFDEPFDGSTEWMRWDERVPQWFSDYRSQV